ncbi:hypothetical protein PLESTB_001076600 [Pleodorina starrii]|uniref:Uncharacterized protein n=1 Tax=Pleodorina starrii TaxID=330485 RepID=A0A9W6F557_9CHLO|nr:hypothetical protein PLESTB_001076600 [Pleodorina starrii]GLC74939.1 hypothetical protein PLESTF_001575100 [Pleodorina starrii]
MIPQTAFVCQNIQKIRWGITASELCTDDGEKPHSSRAQFVCEAPATADFASSRIHMSEVVILRAGCQPASARKPCFDATAPTTSSCGHSSYCQQGLSEPAHPEGSGSLCWPRPTYIPSTSPTISELNCAADASAEAARACDENSLYSGWTLKPPGIASATRRGDADGRASEAHKRASNDGAQHGISLPRPLSCNTKMRATVVAGVAPQSLSTQSAEQLLFGRGHAVRLSRDARARGQSPLPLGEGIFHPVSAASETQPLGYARGAEAAAGGLEHLAGSPRQGHGTLAAAHVRGQGRALQPPSTDDVRQSAAGFAARHPHLEQGRKRSWHEASGAMSEGLEAAAAAAAQQQQQSQQQEGALPTGGPKLRRLESGPLDAPGLQRLATAADALLRAPPFRLHEAAAALTGGRDLDVGLAPRLDPGSAGDMEPSGGRVAATPRSAGGHEPATTSDMQLPYGEHPNGPSCRRQHQAGEPLGDPRRGGLPAGSWSQCQPQLLEQLEQELALLQGECNAWPQLEPGAAGALHERRAAAAPAHVRALDRASVGGALAHHARAVGPCHEGLCARTDSPPRQAPSVPAPPSGGQAASVAALGREPCGARGPAAGAKAPPVAQPPPNAALRPADRAVPRPQALAVPMGQMASQPADAAHRPAGREALHEALILLTTKYYAERGLPIKK